jgi:RNA polymerase sigma-70 factor (ECF subfamily)
MMFAFWRPQKIKHGGNSLRTPIKRSAREGQPLKGSGDVNSELQELVERAQAGDREAFGEIYERVAPKVYSYLYHHTNGRAQLAEDLVEEVFVKVLEKLDRYHDRGLPFISWVYRISHNHLVDYFRTLPKQGIISVEDCFGLAEERAERSLDEALTNNELARALQRLTEDQRRVIVLRFLQGMNIAETARIIGKSEDAVKKLQSRGLLGLRRALGPTSLAELAAA